MTSAGYDRMVELVAENSALEAEELVAMATDEGFNAADAMPRNAVDGALVTCSHST